jgi:hypothetical protein
MNNIYNNSKVLKKSYNKNNRNKNIRLKKTRKHRKQLIHTKPQEEGESEKPFIIGLIYSESCIHCKNLEPHWEVMKSRLDVNNQFKKKHGMIRKIEYSNKEEIQTLDPNIRYDGVPTIFKKKGDKLEYYGGNRDADSLVIWALKDIVSEEKNKEEYGEPDLFKRLFGGFIHHTKSIRIKSNSNSNSKSKKSRSKNTRIQTLKNSTK